MYSRVYVEITTICNKNCTFCPGTTRKKKPMTMEEFQQIVQKLKGITGYLYFHVMGEPLTHPLLPDFIQYAVAEGFKVVITTNGTLLAKRGAELLKSGIYKVNISVHSFEDGSREEYLRYVQDCAKFADCAGKKGILTILRLWNNGYDEGRNINTLAALKEYFAAEEWAEDSRGYRIRNKIHLEYGERFEWPDRTKEDKGAEVFCYGLKDHFAILCDGTVIPCCMDREGELALGNIFKQPLEEILSSKRASAIRDGFRQRQATEELCRKCGYARRFR